MTTMKWIPCVERMPEGMGLVIVSATCECCGTETRDTAWLDSERGWRDFDGDGEGGMGQWKITHWQPLPAAPVKNHHGPNVLPKAAR